MKKLSILFFVVTAAFTTLQAQVDRSKYPTPGPAPKINIQEPATFTLSNGLKVYVVENHKVPKVSYTLVLDRDAIAEKDKAGMTEFFGGMMMAGSKIYNKEQIDAKIDMLGASVNFGAASASISTLKKSNELVLSIFNDILLNPTFPEDELEKMKKLAISNLASSKDNAESLMSTLKKSVLYGADHAYGEVMTAQSIENIHKEDIVTYYNTYFRPNIGHLAIVGDITIEEAKQLANKYFGSWKNAEVPKHTWTKPQAPSQNVISMIHRPNSPQALVEVYYPIELPFNDPEAIKAQIVGNIMGGGASSRMFMNLREDKGYTYGAYGGVRTGELNGLINTSANVGNNVADSALVEILKELKKLQNKTITADELALAKGTLSGSFARSMESPSTIANFAINRELHKLNPDHYTTYLNRLNAITLDEVNAYAEKIFKDQGVFISVVGNVDALQPKLEALGAITIYDTDGRKLEAAQAADISAEEVFARFYKAMGGLDQLKAIKTVRQKGQAEIQGMTLEMDMIVDQTKQISVQSIKMGGQEMTRTFVSSDQVSISAMGQQQTLEGNEKLDAQLGRFVVTELGFMDQGLKSVNEGLVDLDGKKVYKIATTTKGGKIIRSYYDQQTGLRLRLEDETSGITTYGDYKPFNGVLFATKQAVQSPALPVTLEMKILSVELDITLTEADLKP
jgi:zinc protease